MSTAPRERAPGGIASLAGLAAERFGLLTRLDLLEAGMSLQAIRRRVRNSELHQVYPGVYRIAGVPRSWHQQLMAAHLWAGPNSCVSHRSAAVLLELDGYRPGPIEITTTRSLKSAYGIIVHRTPRLWGYDMMVDRRFTLTTPARTILDLGTISTLDRVELALEDALRRKLTTVAALNWELHTRGGRGRPGSAALKELLRRRPEGHVPTASRLEVKVDRVLRTEALPEFNRQRPVQTRIGTVHPDFVFASYPVVIEADSYRWHSGHRAWQRDKNRYRALRAAGWDVIEVTWDDIQNRRRQFVEDVRAALLRAGWDGRS